MQTFKSACELDGPKSDAEIALFELKADLMDAITAELEKSGEIQTDLVHRLGISQPRISNLMQGRVSKFSLGALVEIAVRAGLIINVDISK